MSASYKIKFAGRIIGEATIDELKVMAGRGQIGSLHKLSADGQAWFYASELPGLFPDAPHVPNSPAPDAAPLGASAAPAHEAGVDAVEVVEDGDEWMLLIRGRQQGPYSTDTVLEFVNNGRLAVGDMVWGQGWEDWKPAEALFPNLRKRINPAAAVGGFFVAIGKGFVTVLWAIINAITFIPRVVFGALWRWLTLRRHPPVPREQQSLSILAVGSIILGVLWVFGLASAGAVVLSGLAMHDIYTSRGYTRGAWWAWGGMFVGVIGLVLSYVLFFK